MVAKILTITGRVQGVFYRKSFCERSIELELTGWVRNLENGNVEAFVQGLEDNVQKIEAWSLKGPIMAKVISVESVDVELNLEFKNFEIRRED